MDIKESEYEKLGAFYLGRSYDHKSRDIIDELCMLDSRDLVTHGVVLGMTGSGKTGLCLSLLEEAAIDGIPAIVIDPKGDIANLALTFPEMRVKDFKPWVNEEEARKKNISVDEHAKNQRDLWVNGLKKWGQTPARARRLREKVDISIYTPGSTAGLPVSILSSLDAPGFEILDDAELFADRVENSATGLLSLLGVNADPIQSKEHILLSAILSHAWQAEKNLDIESLIRHIQAPPFNKIGVMDIESFLPESKRSDLAMKLNGLIASPGFAVWLKGEPLNIQRMLFGDSGKPRVSIFSIAHLNDSERMFFVAMLLNQCVGWMRSQTGSSSLRALLYMDEIFGYLPPSGNPPSKKPMMTILKQARAFGFGALLATQNPVDLDYKALSNIGCWFLGRLQTERDKMRVLDGLEGAAQSAGNSFKRKDLDSLLSGLGKRVFLLNNTHAKAPQLFQTRWALSYLRGPISRRQIRQLMKEQRAAIKEERSENTNALSSTTSKKGAPSTPPGVDVLYLPAKTATRSSRIIYRPALLRAATIDFDNAKKKIRGKIEASALHPISSEKNEPDFLTNLKPQTKIAEMRERPEPDSEFAELPGWALNQKNFERAEKDADEYFYKNYSLELFVSPSTGEFSQPGESEADFRARLQLLIREKRDELVDETRKKYDKLIERLERKIEKAADKVEIQKSQARGAKLSAAASIGGALLGSLLGGRRRSIFSRTGGAGRAWRESREAAVAERDLDRLQEDMKKLEDELRVEVESIERNFDPLRESFTTERISPYKKDITPKLTALAWLPYFYEEGEDSASSKQAWV